MATFPSSSRTYRLGIDTGGTFTDFVLYDEARRSLRRHKVASTPDNPAEAICQGLQELCAHEGLTPGDVSFLIHGTTVATNALLEHKGAPTALLVTQGFRDVLHIMRQDRPRLYDLRARRPEPLVPRPLRYEIPERLLADGTVRTPLDEAAVARIAQDLPAQGVVSVAVCFLHSYVNDTHERRAGEIIRELCPALSITLSSELLPEFKEYERMSTTVINATVQPVLRRYLSDIQADLREIGVRVPLHVMKSNGGVMSAVRAAAESVHTILSGPAGGVLAGTSLAARRGIRNAITVDMGGTSFDVALIADGQVRLARETEIGGHALKAPMLDIHTIGAGGGSQAWIDAGGALRVGPESAGAQPGPACYGRGGTWPTVTDAHVALGRLSPDFFLGGTMALDVAAARRAIDEHLAQPLGLSVPAAAEGILRVVNATMVKGMRHVSVQRGYDPREFVLVAFGGAGPLHAVELALELGLPQVLIPPTPGVHSAQGLLEADFRHDYVHTSLGPFTGEDADALNAAFAQMEADALNVLAEDGVIPAGQTARSGRTTNFPPPPLLVRSMDLRYQGQGSELEVPLPGGPLTADTLAHVLAEFHSQHERQYGFQRTDQPVERVNLRLAAIVPLPDLDFTATFVVRHESAVAAATFVVRHESAVAAARKTEREVFLQGRWQTVAVYERSRLHPGHILKGPAIIEQMDSTTLIYPGQTAEGDEWGNLVIEIHDS